MASALKGLISLISIAVCLGFAGLGLLPSDPGLNFFPRLRARVVLAVGWVMLLGSCLAQVATAQIFLGAVPADIGQSTNSVLNVATNKRYSVSPDKAHLVVLDLTRASTSYVTTCATPQTVAVNPATNRVYVGCGSKLQVFRGDTNAMVANIALPLGTLTAVIVVNPVTNMVFVFDNGGHLNAVDGSNNTWLRTVDIFGGPIAADIDPVTNMVYVLSLTYAANTSVNGSYMTVLNGAKSIYTGNGTATVHELIIHQIDSSGPFYGYFLTSNPVTNKIYITTDTGQLIIYNGATNAVITTLHLPNLALDYAPVVDPARNRIYALNLNRSPSNPLTASVSVVDGSSDSIIATDKYFSVQDEEETRAAGVNPSTNRLLAINSYGTYIASLDGNGGLSSYFTLYPPTCFCPGPNPYYGSLTINPISNKWYVDQSSFVGPQPVGVSGFDDSLNPAPLVNVGSSPQGVAVNPATGLAYVANHGDGTVSIVNTTTNAVVATVGASALVGATAMAVNSATNTVYVVNGSNNTVGVINGTTYSGNITVGSSPTGIAINPVTGFVYVTNDGSGSVSVINSSNQVVKTLAVGSSPESVAVDAGTGNVFVANDADGTVTVISGYANTVLRTVSVGSGPRAVVINPSTHKVYVANLGSDTVTVIDGLTFQTTSVNVGDGPNAMAVNPVTGQVYVINGNAGSMSVIDGVSNSTVATVTVAGALRVAVDVLSNRIFVTSGSGNVTVLDGASYAAAVLPFPGRPSAIVFDPGTSKVIFTNSITNQIGLMTPDTLKTPLSTTITSTPDPQQIGNANLYQTTNTTPSFAVAVASAYKTSTAYTGKSGTTNPFPTAVYYQVDGGDGTWQSNTNGISQGIDSAVFIVTPPALLPGSHILYAFAAYGNETGQPTASYNESNQPGIGNAPEIGNIVAYPFTVFPATSFTFVSADNTTVHSNANVEFDVSVNSSGTAPTGTVVFTSTLAGAVTQLGSATLVNGSASLTTSFAVDGQYTVAATYLGDINNIGSSSTLLETVYTNDVTSTTVGVNPSTIMLGGFTTLSVLVKDVTHPAQTVGGSVVFTDVAGATILTIGQTDSSQPNYIQVHSTGAGNIAYTPTGAGSHQITATYYSGSILTNANSTDSVGKTLLVLSPQTITFPQPTTPVAIGSTATLAATSTSGLPVTYTVTSNVASITGSTITFTNAGMVVIAANQAGDGASYGAASTVSRSVVVAGAPISYAAGTVPVGSSVTTLVATVNITTAGTIGSTLANAIKVVTQGTTGLDYGYVSGGTCKTGVTYTAGAVCTVNYSFSPKAPGARQGAILLATGSGTVMGTSYLGGIGTGPMGLFSAPASALLAAGQANLSSIFVDVANNMYVTEDTGVSEFSSQGAQTILPTATVPTGIVVDGAGNVYFGRANQVYEIPAGTSTQVAIASIASSNYSLAADTAGNLLVMGASPNNLYRIAAGTRALTKIVSAGQSGPGGSMGLCLAMTTDANNNIYIADSTNYKIYRVDAITSAVTVVITQSSPNNPSGIAIDAAKNLYVTNQNGGPLFRYAYTGTGYSAAQQFTKLSGMNVAMGSDGALFLMNASQILKYNRSITPVLTFASTNVGQSSAQQVETFENDGNSNLTISALTGTNANVSGAATTCSSTTALAAASTCDLGIVFAPTAAATSLAGSLTITSNNLNLSGSTQTVSLAGPATKQTKTIMFPQPVTPVTIGGSATLLATASNGDPVTYTVTGATATIVGNLITYTTAGTVKIAANSAATSSYSAAPTVTDNVTVLAVPSILWTPSSASVLIGNAVGAGVLNASSLTPGTIAYTATLLPSGTPAAITAASILPAGSYTLTAAFTPTNPAAFTSASTTIAFVVRNEAVFVAGSGKVFSLFIDGGQQSVATSGGGTGAAVGANGLLWSIDSGGNSVTTFTNAGVRGTMYSGGGLSGATALAIDGAGQAWIANGNGSLSVLSSAGAPVSILTTPSAGGLSGVAIDASGNVWISDSTDNTIIEVLGGAAPVAPLAITTQTGSAASRP